MLLKLVLTTGVVVVATLATRSWAKRALLDVPTERSSHTQPTPRGGGLAVCLGLGIAPAMFPVLRESLLGALLFAIAVLSFVDDVNSIGAKTRLVAHVAIGALAVGAYGPYPQLWVPPLVTITGPTIVAALTMVWLVGLTNAYNFMDGIDGLAAVQAVIAGVLWYMLGYRHDLPMVSTLGAVIAAAVLGFLPFNWPRATIFLGDVGSATLGLAFAVLPLLAGTADSRPWAAACGILVVWPFVFDAGYTLVRRARRGEAILEAHRSHIYQRLVIAGWSHRDTTLLYGSLATVCGSAALAVADGQWWWGWTAAGIGIVVPLVLVRRAEAQHFAGGA